jgi:ABC-2 type transport system ATP-binding protein
MDARLQNVTKGYGTLRALDGATVAFPKGKITCVVGLNGAGKTTLLRCLAGLSVPDDGSVFLDEELLNRGRLDLRRRFYFLPDTPTLFDDQPVSRNLSRILHLYEADNRPEMSQRVGQLLEDLDMLALVEKRADTLSRGQYYKVGLCLLLAIDPDLWLLDEPFASGMDPQGITVFRRAARAAANAGKTVIYTTQLIDLAEKFSDQICVLNQGKVEKTIATADLVAGTEGGALESLLEKLRDPVA